MDTSTWDLVLLARIQFAANITFHILLPTISIGRGWWQLFFRARWLATRDPRWLVAWRYWTKIFALTFALGVVSGITMSFQFGTNWPGLMEKVGNIAGPLLGYEACVRRPGRRQQHHAEEGGLEEERCQHLRASVTVAAVLIPLQIAVGDAHGPSTLEHQPQKIAAMEALWRTVRVAPLVLFAWHPTSAPAATGSRSRCRAVPHWFGPTRAMAHCGA